MIRDRLCLNAILLPLCLAGIVGAGEPGPKLILKASNASPQVFERIEFQVDGVPVVTNPYNTDSILLELEAVAPSGKRLRIRGFYSHNFSRTVQGEREVLPCKQCGAPVERPFYKRKDFCSDRCQQKHYNDNRPKTTPELVTRECQECGKEFSTDFWKKVYCSHACVRRAWKRKQQLE